MSYKLNLWVPNSNSRKLKLELMAYAPTGHMLPDSNDNFIDNTIF